MSPALTHEIPDVGVEALEFCEQRVAGVAVLVEQLARLVGDPQRLVVLARLASDVTISILEEAFKQN